MKTIFLSGLMALGAYSYAQAPANVPYSYGFETLDNWTFINHGAAADGWGIFELGTIPAIEGTKYAVYLYDENFAADAWAISRPVNLTAGVSYTIKFKYTASVDFLTEKLRVTVGTDKTVAAQQAGLTIFNNENINNINWQEGTGTFTPQADGVYYVGFQVYSNANQQLLALDDITVTATMGTEDVVKNTMAIYPNPATTIVNFTDVVDSVIVKDLHGRMLKHYVNVNAIDVAWLPEGMYLLEMLADKRSTTLKFIKE